MADEVDLILQDSSNLAKIDTHNLESLPLIGLKQQSSTYSSGVSGPGGSTKAFYYQEDKIDMSRFKEMVPSPAITYPFELDDFQKRAIYRLE